MGVDGGASVSVATSRRPRPCGLLGGAVAAALFGAAACTSTEAPAPPSAAPVASVTVVPSADNLLVGDTQQLTALLRDAKGRPVTPRDISWESLNSETATVSPAGLVQGRTPGPARIVATAEGQSGAAVIIVWPTRPDTAECEAPRPGWIWCDDFERDRLKQYFGYNPADGGFERVPAVGYGGSVGMRARFVRIGQVQAGSLHLAFGKTPSPHFRAVDAGTALYREIYWRHFVKFQAGWTGGGGNKLSRAQGIVTRQWAQTMMAHVWSGSADDHPDQLGIVPASGTDPSGRLRTTSYNDFPNFRWLATAWSRTPVFGLGYVGKWYCVEAHARLNDPGRSNGVFELWINGGLEAQLDRLNWQGAYSEYGINTVFLENYWNDGAPQPQERYFDNFIVSTQPIGC